MFSIFVLKKSLHDELHLAEQESAQFNFKRTAATCGLSFYMQT